MKSLLRILVILAIDAMVSACSTIKGSTVYEKQNFVVKMQQETLQQLYKKHPQARSQIASSAGYAIFSNINTNIIFITTSGGYGIATSNSKKRTFMKMAGLGVGLGAGVRDMRLILIFNKKHDFDTFVDDGWDFSGQAGVAAQSDEQGDHVNATKSVDLDIITYQLTKAGLSIEATIEGAKFWKDEDLN